MFAAYSAKAIETIENVPLYRIACECEPGLYWDNIAGWVSSDASVFSQHERDTLNLPIGGIWEEF